MSQSTTASLPRVSLNTSCTPLARALTELGIRPFNPASVREYKDRMLVKANPPVTLASLTIRILHLISTLTLFTSLILSLFAWHSISLRAEWYSLATLVLSVLVTCVLDGLLPVRSYFWREQPLHSYRGYIPEAARRQARAVEEKLPGVKLSVDELAYTDDPFLIVRHRKEKYVIVRWDEHSYDAEFM